MSAKATPGPSNDIKVTCMNGNPQTDDSMILEPPSPKTILLIEDDEAVRDSTRLALVQFGFQVIEAANGDDAVLLCQACGGQIDATVVDVVMPREWGDEVVRRLLAISPQMQVIYISGHSEESLRNDGALKVGDVFFAKPFYPSLVADKIYEMLGIPNPITAGFAATDTVRGSRLRDTSRGTGNGLSRENTHRRPTSTTEDRSEDPASRG